jgi:aryl-alcohol dehydrogenase-like predicted oxidoreductase
MIKTLRLGDVDVPVPGFGAMGISFALGNNLSYEEAEPVLLRAIELGCTFWDTAVCLNECPWNAWSTNHDYRCLTATV